MRLKQTCLLSWKGYAKCQWKKAICDSLSYCAPQKSTRHSIWEPASALCFSNKEPEERRDEIYGETKWEMGEKRGGEEGGEKPRWDCALVVELYKSSLFLFLAFVSLFQELCEVFSLTWSKLEPRQEVKLTVSLCWMSINGGREKRKQNRGTKTTADGGEEGNKMNWC